MWFVYTANEAQNIRENKLFRKKHFSVFTDDGMEENKIKPNIIKRKQIYFKSIYFSSFLSPRQPIRKRLPFKTNERKQLTDETAERSLSHRLLLRGNVLRWDDFHFATKLRRCIRRHFVFRHDLNLGKLYEILLNRRKTLNCSLIACNFHLIKLIVFVLLTAQCSCAMLQWERKNWLVARLHQCFVQNVSLMRRNIVATSTISMTIW